MKNKKQESGSTIDRINNIIRKAKGLDQETLVALKYMIFIFVVADLFGIYWYFNLKKLGSAFLMVLIVALAIILILERRYSDNKMGQNQDKINDLKKQVKDLEEKEEKEEKIKKLEDEINKLKGESVDNDNYRDDSSLGFDLGIGSSEEFNKRTQKALGA